MPSNRHLVAALGLAAALLAAADCAIGDEPPPGVVQILPRGGIPAVVDPEFVTAAEAEIPGDAWVLGVEIGGEARAFSLSLLNHHEVVNDEIAGTAYAAVW